MASKDSARGKAWERAAGAAFGLRRRRNGEGLGYDDCVQLDGSDAPISLECKSYATVQMRQDWITQARRNADGRPWIIAQRPRGWRRPIATVDLGWLADLCDRAGITFTTDQPKEEHGSEGISTE